VPKPNKITPNTGGGFNANRSARPFVKGNRPAIVAKVEPTEEVKNQIRNFRKLQGKGGKSKAANRRDKRDTQQSKKSDDEQRALMRK
jgi:translation initiation factor IF-2